MYMSDVHRKPCNRASSCQNLAIDNPVKHCQNFQYIRSKKKFCSLQRRVSDHNFPPGILQP